MLRTYIFTERERRILRGFVAGDIDVKNRPLSKILSRVRTFKRLTGDVDLYLRVREAVATASA